MAKAPKCVANRREWPFPEDDRTPEEQLKEQMISLHNYYAGRGPHINFTHNALAKVASEALRKTTLRKVN
jgi:hypothetical protein